MGELFLIYMHRFDNTALPLMECLSLLSFGASDVLLFNTNNVQTPQNAKVFGVIEGKISVL